MPNPLDVCVVGFMGLGQTLGRETGLESVLVDCCCVKDKNVLVLQKQFNDDIVGVTRYLARIFTRFPEARRVLTGYSFGGFTAVNCMWGLMEMGFYNLVGVLCDPVWRSKFRVLWPLSLNGRGDIVIPESVSELHTYRQHLTRIQGAGIHIANEDVTQWLTDDIRNDVEHSGMDSLPAFHAKLKEVVER